MTAVVGGIVYEVGMDISGLIAGSAAARRHLEGLNGATVGANRGLSNLDRQVNNTGASMSRFSVIAGSLMAYLSAQKIAEYADAWTVLNNKVSNSIRSGESQADVMQRVFDISQATQSSLNGTATLYARLERGTRTLNTSSEDLARLTTIINQGFAVSGATTQEAENAIVQLSQGLAAGALRGEEFNSVSEQGSRLMIALADSLGVGLGELRAMAAQGKLTNEVIVNGLLSQGDVIGKEFAKTTVTISQGLLVAGNNITKFFGENSTVKAFAAIFRDSVVGLSENIGVLSGALVAAAAFMGSRYVGALTLAAAAKVRLALSTREQTAAEQLAAAATARMTASNLAEATAAKSRAVTELQLSFNLRQAAVSAEQVAIAEARLTAARVAATAAVRNYNQANAANAAAQARIVSGAGLASRALSLVGGPVGAAMLAASAIFYFKQRSDEARNSAVSLADSVNELTAKFKSMTAVQIAASIAKLREQIPELTDAQNEAQDAFDTTTSRVAKLRREIERYGENTTRGKQAAAVLQDAMDAQSIAADKLTEAQNRLSRVYSAVSIGQAQLTTGLKQGIDLLKRDQEEVGVSTGMLNHFADALDLASKAKANFNSTSLIVERPKKLQEYLDKLQERVEVESILNDRLREQQEAENDALALGGSDNDIKMARDRAGAIYDSRKAQQEYNKEQKEGQSSAKKSAAQAESVASKLAKLRRESDLTTESVEKRRIEEAGLRASESLGSAASAAQIEEARKIGEANEIAALSIQKRAEAEQANKGASQVIAQAKVSVNPLTGEAEDPLAQINLEESQKLEVYQGYYDAGLIDIQTFEDTKTAIQQMAANERNQISKDENETQRQNMSDLLGSSGDFFGEMAGLVGDYAGESSSAYRTLFAASKAFSIAQATMNMVTAISNASALPWPANIPAIAFAAAQGAALISQVRSASYGGARKNGGPVNAGSMYQVGENGLPEIFQASNGSQYMIPGDNGRVISNKDMGSGGGGGVVVYNSITNNTSSRVTTSASSNADGSVTIQTLVADIEENGSLAQAITRNTTASRRAND